MASSTSGSICEYVDGKPPSASGSEAPGSEAPGSEGPGPGSGSGSESSSARETSSAISPARETSSSPFTARRNLPSSASASRRMPRCRANAGAADPDPEPGPGASEPGASEPGASEPGASEPGASEPGASESGASDSPLVGSGGSDRRRFANARIPRPGADDPTPRESPSRLSEPLAGFPPAPMSSARTSSGNSAHVASSTRTPADAARAAAAANDDRRPGPNPVAVGAPPSSAPVPPSRVPSSARAGDSPSSTPSDQTTRLRFADDPNAPRDEPRDLAADLSADGGGGADRGADGADVVVVRGVVIFVSCRSSVGTTTRATPSTGNATRTRVAVASNPAATSAPAIAAEFSSTFASSFASSFASLTKRFPRAHRNDRVGSTTAARAPYAAAEDAAATRIASSDANRRESRPAVDVVVVSRRARRLGTTLVATRPARWRGFDGEFRGSGFRDSRRRVQRRVHRGLGDCSRRAGIFEFFLSGRSPRYWGRSKAPNTLANFRRRRRRRAFEPGRGRR